MVMKCYDVVLSATAADAESTELSIPLFDIDSVTVMGMDPTEQTFGVAIHSLPRLGETHVYCLRCAMTCWLFMMCFPSRHTGVDLR